MLASADTRKQRRPGKTAATPRLPPTICTALRCTALRCARPRSLPCQCRDTLGSHLGQQQGHWVGVALAHQGNCDGGHEQDRGDVVEEGGEEGRGQPAQQEEKEQGQRMAAAAGVAR